MVILVLLWRNGRKEKCNSHWAMRKILVNLPMILENDARVLNGACGMSSIPLSSWMRFSASRNKLFKWLPNESGDLTRLYAYKKVKWNEKGTQLQCNWPKKRKKERNQSINQLILMCIKPKLNENYGIHLFPSMAPCCNNIFVSERLLLRTATVSGDSPSVFKLHSSVK